MVETIRCSFWEFCFVIQSNPTFSISQNFHCSQRHGGRGGAYWNDGTYSGIRRIITTTNGNNWLTSIQLHYALEGGASVKDKYIEALPHGLGFEQDNRIVVSSVLCS